jgi:hypothetical protein
MTRRVLAALVAAPLVIASCAKKEEPAPVAQQQAAPTVAPTTTLPPPTPTAVPTPPPVWRTLRWGMTRAEVMAALPKEAQRLAKAADFAQPQIGSSLVPGSGDISIPSYESDGVTYRVLFGFGADKLDRIHLAVPKAAVSTCGDVEKVLTDTHGAATKRTATGASLKGEEIVWTLPDQTIVLTCAGVPSLGFVSVSLDRLAPPPPSAAAQ